MPKIGELLSQHGMLTSICRSLSSADLANLAATCSEHRTYITSSKPIYYMLMSSTICSGAGLKVQEKLFGPREALFVVVGDEDSYEEFYDSDPEEKKCLGADSRPCSDCGVHVCDNCRFHFLYPFEGIRGFDKDNHATMERDWAHGVEENGIDGRPIKKIECRKAFDMYWNKRYKFFCPSCEPPLLPEVNDYDICQCTFYDHFVGRRWLCLPCFFREEAAAQKVTNEKVAGYDSSTKTYIKASHHLLFTFRTLLTVLQDEVCDCGALARQTIEGCRTCHGANGWCLRRTEQRRQKILDQLGYQPERKGVLAQLG